MRSPQSVVCTLLVLFACFSSRVSAKRNIPGFTSIIALNISNKWLWPEDDSPVFYRHFYQKVTWQEAQSVCEYNRAKLVTVETSMQYDQVRAYLKELDVNNLVWIGLKKEASRFAWRDSSPLEGEGYWLESPPKEPESLCAALDPWKDYRWKTFNCAGPETATFICEIPIPEWADHGYTGCMLDSLPSLTITYHPEDESVHLLHDCGLDGSRTVACKGTADKRDLMMLLHCNQNISTWYRGMWDSAISVSARHRRSSSFPGEFTTPTHFVFANDLFDYDDEQSKTTADSARINDDSANAVLRDDISDPAGIKTDGTVPQDFMVGFSPEDLSFADEPIKSLPLGNFPVIQDLGQHNFEKPAPDVNVVYNSSTTETLSKLTVGTETQLVRSVNNTNSGLKSETSTISLEPSTSSGIKDGSKGLKEMLVSGFEETAKRLEKTAEKTGKLVESTVKELGKTFDSTKTEVTDSLKGLNFENNITIEYKDMNNSGEPILNLNTPKKQLVSESLTLSKEGGESKVKEKVDNNMKIDKNIDFFEKASIESESGKYAQNYVNSGIQNLLKNTEKKLSNSKDFMNNRAKSDQLSTKTPDVTQKLEQSTKMETQLTEKDADKTETVVSTTPGAFKKEILKALQEAKEKAAASFDRVDDSIETLYDKIIPTVKIGVESITKKTEMTTLTYPSTTVKNVEVTTKNKQSDVVLKSTPISIIARTEHNKHPEETPSLVILDSKGHSLNSNQFESHSEDEVTDNTSTDFDRTTENHLEFKPFFENEINVSKKSFVVNMTNSTNNQTVGATTRSTTTAKYERRNLPPVLMIDKVEQLNEAAAVGDATTTVMTQSTSLKPAPGSSTTPAVRTESQTIKKTLPAILGNKQPINPSTTRSSTSNAQSTSTNTPVTAKKIEPVPDLPEKPKRSPLFSQQQHRSHYPYFLGRILG